MSNTELTAELSHEYYNDCGSGCQPGSGGEQMSGGRDGRTTDFHQCEVRLRERSLGRIDPARRNKQAIETKPREISGDGRQIGKAVIT